MKTWKRYPGYGRTAKMVEASRLKAGALIPLMTPERLTFLEREVPEGMTISEYLVSGLLDDAMSGAEE